MKDAAARIQAEQGGQAAESDADAILRTSGVRSEQMTEAQVSRALLVDPVSELGSARAYREAEAAPLEARVNLNVKQLNKGLGSHEKADVGIRAFGNLLGQVFGDQAFRLSGGNFRVFGQTQEELEAGLKKIKRMLPKVGGIQLTMSHEIGKPTDQGPLPPAESVQGMTQEQRVWAYTHDVKTGEFNANKFREDEAEHEGPAGAADLRALGTISNLFGREYGDRYQALVPRAAKRLGLVPYRMGGDEWAFLSTEPITAEALRAKLRVLTKWLGRATLGGTVDGRALKFKGRVTHAVGRNYAEAEVRAEYKKRKSNWLIDRYIRRSRSEPGLGGTGPVSPAGDEVGSDRTDGSGPRRTDGGRGPAPAAGTPAVLDEEVAPSEQYPDWKDAKAGEVFGTDPDGKRLLLVQRGLDRKADAKALAEKENGEVWTDGPRTWAVVKRVTAAKKPTLGDALTKKKPAPKKKPAVPPSAETAPPPSAADEAAAATEFQQNAVRDAVANRGISGDELENAVDLAADLREKGGVITPAGEAVVYHRTSAENAEKIIRDKAMVGKEDGLFFGTSPTGQIEGYGSTAIRVTIPLERLLLNDVFPSEAHVRLPLRTGRKYAVEATVVPSEAAEISTPEPEAAAATEAERITARREEFELDLARELDRVRKAKRKAKRKGKRSRAAVSLKKLAEKYGLSDAGYQALDVIAGRAILQLDAKPLEAAKAAVESYLASEISLPAAEASVAEEPATEKAPAKIREEHKPDRLSGQISSAEAVTAKDIAAKYPQFYQRTREKLPLGRGQGKRSGGQVLGSMATVGLEISYNPNKFDDLENITEEQKAELRSLEVLDSTWYMQARVAGMDHENAMRYTYYKHGDLSTRDWQGLLTQEPASAEVVGEQQPERTDEEIAKLNAEYRAKTEAAFVAAWFAGDEVNGNDLVNMLRVHDIKVPDALRQRLQHDDTKVSRTSARGRGMKRGEAKKVHRFASGAMFDLKKKIEAKPESRRVEDLSFDEFQELANQGQYLKYSGQDAADVLRGDAPLRDKAAMYGGRIINEMLKFPPGLALEEGDPNAKKKSDLEKQLRAAYNQMLADAKKLEAKPTEESPDEKVRRTAAESMAKTKAFADENVQRVRDIIGDQEVGAIKMGRPDGLTIIISPDSRSPGKWRTTDFTEKGQPRGHEVFETWENAVRSASGQVGIEGPPIALAREWVVTEAVARTTPAAPESREPWQMTRAEFTRSRNEPVVEAAKKYMAEGGEIRVATQMRVTPLSKPEHIRLSKSGEVQTRERRTWVTNIDSQVDDIARQIGLPVASLGERVYHSAEVEQALAAGRDVPAEVLAEYPDLIAKKKAGERRAESKERLEELAKPKQLERTYGWDQQIAENLRPGSGPIVTPGGFTYEMVKVQGQLQVVRTDPDGEEKGVVGYGGQRFTNEVTAADWARMDARDRDKASTEDLKERLTELAAEYTAAAKAKNTAKLADVAAAADIVALEATDTAVKSGAGTLANSARSTLNNVLSQKKPAEEKPKRKKKSEEGQKSAGQIAREARELQAKRVAEAQRVTAEQVQIYSKLPNKLMGLVWHNVDQDMNVPIGLAEDTGNRIGLDLQAEGLAEQDEQGNWRLTAQGEALFTAVRQLQLGLPWDRHTPNPMAVPETGGLSRFTEADYAGGKPFGRQAWTNARVMMFTPAPKKRSVGNLLENVKLSSKGMEQAIPAEADLEPGPITPVLIREQDLETRQVIFSNGTALDADYVDYVMRAVPDAEFYSAGEKRPVVVLHAKKKGKYEQRIAGIIMPISVREDNVAEQALELAERMGKAPAESVFDLGAAKALRDRYPRGEKVKVKIGDAEFDGTEIVPGLVLAKGPNGRFLVKKDTGQSLPTNGLENERQYLAAGHIAGQLFDWTKEWTAEDGKRLMHTWDQVTRWVGSQQAEAYLREDDQLAAALDALPGVLDLAYGRKVFPAGYSQSLRPTPAPAKAAEVENIRQEIEKKGEAAGGRVRANVRAKADRMLKSGEITAEQHAEITGKYAATEADKKGEGGKNWSVTKDEKDGWRWEATDPKGEKQHGWTREKADALKEAQSIAETGASALEYNMTSGSRGRTPRGPQTPRPAEVKARPEKAKTLDDKYPQAWELLEGDFYERRRTSRITDYERGIKQQEEKLKKLKKGTKAREKVETTIFWWKKNIENLRQFTPEKLGWKKAYVATVKKAISKGLPVPQEVVNQYPEFSKAVDARARYEKGRHTSYANKSIAVSEVTKDQYGFKVKRQDGKAISDEQVQEIGQAADDMQEALGDLTDLWRKTDPTVAHTSGKHPFLSTAGGVYHPLDRTITVGVRIGTPVRAFAHEMAHWLDHESGAVAGYDMRIRTKSGKALKSSSAAEAATRGKAGREALQLIADATMAINDIWGVRKILRAKQKNQATQAEKDVIARAKVQLSAYWREPWEVFARLTEQYVATKLGRESEAAESPEYYESHPGWWTKDEFAKLMPRVEQEIQRRMQVLREGKPFGAENKWVTRDEAQSLRAEIFRELGSGTAPAGLKALTVTPKVLRLGLFYFEGGIRKFSDWAERMTADLGPLVKPVLRKIWKGIKAQRLQITEVAKALEQKPKAKDVRERTAELVRPRIRKQVKAAREGGAAFALTPQELLTYVMEAQEKGAAAGAQAGAVDLQSTHAALAEYARAVIPEDQPDLLAQAMARIAVARTPSEVDRVARYIARAEEQIAERQGLKLSRETLVSGLMALAQEKLGRKTKGGELVDTEDLAVVRHAIESKAAKAFGYRQMRAMGVSISVLIEQREKRAAEREFKDYWRDRVRRRKYPKVVRQKIDALVEGFSLTKPTAKTLERLNDLVEGYDLGVFGALPTKVIENARARLAAAQKGLLRDMSAADIREITNSLRAVVEMADAETQAKFQKRAQDALRQKIEAMDTVEERFPGRRYASEHGAEEAPARPGLLRQFLGDVSLSSLDTKTFGLGGNQGALRELLYKAPRRSHTRYLELTTRAKDFLIQRLTAMGLEYKDLEQMSEALGRPGWMRRTLGALFTGRKSRVRHVSVELPTAVDERGKRVHQATLTPAELGELLAHMGDPQTWNELLRRDSYGLWIARNPQAGALQLTIEDLHALKAAAEAEPHVQALVSAMKEYVGGQLREDLEAVWLDENGWSLQTHDGYWPRRRRGEYRYTDPNEAMRQWVDAQLQHMGILQERTGSKAPIIVGDMFGTFFAHVNQASAYIAKTRAIADAMRLIDDHAFAQTVRESVRNGDNLLRDIEDTVKDFRGLNVTDTARSVDRLVDSMLRRAHVGALGVNPRIILYQSVSWFTAMAEMDIRDLAKGTARVRPSKTRAEMVKHSADARVRLEGGGHQILTPGTGGPAAQEFYGKKEGMAERLGMGGIHHADSLVMYAIWEGVKVELEREGWKGEALLKRAAERWVEVVDRTQPTWDLLTIAGIQREARRKPWMKLLIPGLMFSSQRGKNTNITFRAVQEYRHSQRTAADFSRMVYKVALSQLVNGVLVYGIAQGSTMLYRLLFGGGPDDDDREKALSEHLAGIVQRILGNWLVSGDVASVAVQGVERTLRGKPIEWSAPRGSIMHEAYVDAVVGMLRGLQAGRQWWTGERYKAPKGQVGERKAFYTFMRALEDSARAAGVFAGVPVSGPLTMFRQHIPSGPKRRSTYYSRYYKALDKGDAPSAAAALAELMSMGAEAPGIKSSLATRVESKTIPAGLAAAETRYLAARAKGSREGEEEYVRLKRLHTEKIREEYARLRPVIEESLRLYREKKQAAVKKGA